MILHAYVDSICICDCIVGHGDYSTIRIRQTFGTGSSDSVIIGARPSHSTIFGTMFKVRAPTVKL